MISSITNIQTYVIGYTSQQVELEMDITTNRYFLSKILGNNLYLNDFDKVKIINKGKKMTKLQKIFSFF